MKRLGTCCGALALLLACFLGMVRQLMPRVYVRDACSNEIGPGLRTLPSLPFHCGWHQLRPDSNSTKLFAYIQPSGSWCWSNAGFIGKLGNDKGLLIDTLTDPVLTANMLKTIPSGNHGVNTVGGIVYTHPDVDHIFGDQIMPNEIPRFGREEVHAEMLAQVKTVKGLTTMSSLGHYAWCIADSLGWQKLATSLPDKLWKQVKSVLGWARIQWLFGRFNFHEVDAQKVVGLTERISGNEADIPVPGGGFAKFRYMGQIHSKSDSVIMFPESKVCFAGDLLFIGIAPVMWSGPASEWVAALDQLLSETDEAWLFVPGHGPVTDVDGVRLVRSYFEYLNRSVTEKCNATRIEDDHICAVAVLDGLPGELRSAFREPQRILISAKIERMARREGGPVKVDILTKVKFLIEQGAYLVEDLL